MNRRSRLSGALLAGGVLFGALAAPAAAATPRPHAARHPERTIPGRMIDYRSGIQNGLTTRVGPKQNVRSLAAPRSVWKIVWDGKGWTQAAKVVVQNAVDYWASEVASTVTIKIRVKFTDLPGNTLGSAGPTDLLENWEDGTPPPILDTFYPIALANKLAGVDLNGPTAEISARFDSKMPWYMGTDNVVPANKLSFRGTVIHEIGHGLGFLGSGWAGSGTPAIGDTENGHPWVFDLFTERGDGTTLWNQNTWSQRLSDGATKSALKSNDLWFEGPATSPRAKLYAPSSWESGSSYSHLDEKKYPRGSLDSMMTPIGDFGEGNADAGPLVLQIFEDMGWGLPSDRTCAKPGDLNADGFNDVVGVAGNGDLTWAPGTDTGKLLKRRVASPGFGGFKPMVIEDWTGDGCADLIAYTPADGHIYALPVTGSFDVGTFVDIVDFTGWTVTGIAAVGDFTDDGNNDLIVRANVVAGEKGQLWLLAGNGAGSLLPNPNGIVLLGTTLDGVTTSAYTEFFSAGDWNGDGIGDLFVRAKANNGTLKLFPGNGTGGFKTSQSKGTGWNFYNELFGSFDLTGDGFPEIVGRNASNGDLIIERANPTGGFISGTPVISKGWGAFTVID